MGHMRHHAIIVTSWDEKALLDARYHACMIFDKPWPPGERSTGIVGDIIRSPQNGYRSFLVAPDGSKEGWDVSDEGDARRERFIDWLNDQRYDDGSTSLGFVEVQYGDENGHNHVITSDTGWRVDRRTDG